MIGNESEETAVDIRGKMEKQQVKRLEMLVKSDGVKAAIRLAAADIVTLKIQLAKAELVKPTRLSKGKPKKMGVAGNSLRG